MKRQNLLLILLMCAIIILLGTLSVSATTVYLDYTYKIENEEVIITGGEYRDNPRVRIGVASIPETIDGYPVTSIADGAFVGIEELYYVYLPNGLKKIGGGAFGGVDVVEITIPDSVAVIGGGAFSQCTSLESVTIPGCGATTIGEGAFYACINMKKLTIGSGVTSIGDSAFYCCNSLTSVTIENGLKSIGNYAFGCCDNGLSSISIPSSVISIGNNAFEVCRKLSSINVDEDNEYYCSVDGNLYNKDKTVLIQYAVGKKESSFAVPGGVTSIGDYAFVMCESLLDVTLPDGLTGIGNYAFGDCNLTSIKIPQSVIKIGDGVFYNIGNMNTIYYSGDKEAWDNITIGKDNDVLENTTKIYSWHGDSKARIGSKYYATLADAAAAVKDGETITVTGNHSGNGIVVESGRNFTIDFGGYTYTADGSLVGSPNTVTNGFQLLKGSTLTFKNGAIVAGENAVGSRSGKVWEGSARILIQNYADLTLANMTLTGGKRTEYVLSNNFGSAVLSGTTSVISTNNKNAFDVCYQNNKSYADGVSVTVDTTGKIVGNVEYSAYYGATADDVAEKAVLKINAADMSGATLSFSHDESSEIKDVNITVGENVTLAAPEGYKWNDDGKLELIGEAKIFEKVLMLTGVKADGSENEYRAFFTGIDSLDYKEVGFKFAVKVANPPAEAEGKTTLNKNIFGKTVYSSVTISQSGDSKTYTAADFGTDSKYIVGFVYDWSGITKYDEYTIESITYTPYAVKANGDVIEGKTTTVTE